MEPLKVSGNLKVLFLCLFFFSVGFGKYPESTINYTSTDNSYVVIGAFSFEKNAVRFTSYAQDKALEAVYEINPGRNLFYVYVFVSEDRNEANRELFKVRGTHPEFKDAWVYEGQLGSASLNNLEDESGDLRTMTSEITISRQIREPNTNTEEYVPSVQSTEISDEKGKSTIENRETASIDTPNTVEETGLVKEEGIHNFYFNLLNAKRLKEVKGRVKVIDPERAKQLMVAKSHEIVQVREPNNGTNRIKVASDIFGFKEVQYTIDLDNPVTDSTSAFIETIGDSIIVNFELERYKKGDVLVMYNVYFFRDAAIMKNESIYELNSLLDMLQENEKYKVRIHGHTNGNSHGKIIHLDPEDKNFFSLKADHLETNGSAKKLSLFRAYTIQHWLIDQGIAENRMEIKGWGGKKMIYDKHDSQADKNVRVEIEITADQ